MKKRVKSLSLILALSLVLSLAGCGSEAGQTAELHSGKYTGGEDIPVGEYILTKEAGTDTSGILWLSSPDDNLEEEYPSLIYEFVNAKDSASFFISMQKGSILSVPFNCTLTVVDYTKLATGDKIAASAGSYTGGVDMPAGRYLLSFSAEHTGYGILSLSAPDDDLDTDYPSCIYEYIGQGREGTWFISLQENSILNIPFPCDSLTRIDSISIKGSTELNAGYYSAGTDIPEGKYVITFHPGENDSGIAWVSSGSDNLDEEYPSVLYEYIGNNKESTFYITLDEKAKMYLPCKTTIEKDEGIVFK